MLKQTLNNFSLQKNQNDQYYKTLIDENQKIINNLKMQLYNNNNIVGQMIDNNYYNLLVGEKLVALNFVSVDQQINQTIICKNKTEFHNIESILYNKFPQYKEEENYFMCNGNKIKKFKTLEENGINAYTIILNKFV